MEPKPHWCVVRKHFDSAQVIDFYETPEAAQKSYDWFVAVEPGMAFEVVKYVPEGTPEVQEVEDAEVIDSIDFVVE